MPTLIYKYGLRRPIENADLVEDQMRMANRYYNCLIEIEQKRRKAVRKALSEADKRHGLTDLINKADQAAEDLKKERESLKQQRKSTRSRSDTKEQREHVKKKVSELKKLREELKEARAANRGDLIAKEEMAQAQAEAAQERRDARDTCGVFWGTYLIIEAAVDQAAKAPLWSKGSENDPRFRRYGGDGAVAVQLQKGLLVESALTAEDRRLQIEMDPPPPPGSSNRQNKLRRGILRLRVGSNGRDPIWAEWPLQVHRPLPRGAVIKWAKVLRRHVADHDQWELQLTLDVPQPESTHGEGTAAIDIGWRRTDYGIRIAYLIDEWGAEEELLLDPKILSGLRKADDIRSIRDQSQNDMANKLIPWLGGRSLPDWLVNKTKTISKWRSPSRFVSLANEWSSNRFDDDSEGFDLVSSWAENDRHLWQWEAHQRKKSRLRRKDAYRCWAKKLAEKYRDAVIETKFLAKLQRHHLPEDEKPEIQSQRLQQRDASCCDLVECIKHAFTRAGGSVTRVLASQTTQRCHACGNEDPWDAAPEIDHTCEACGATWDQDANACHNLMERYREGQGGKQTGAKKTQAKWARQGRHKKTARNPSGKAAESIASS